MAGVNRSVRGSAFLKMARGQLIDDVRALPSGTRGRLTDEGRAGRSHNIDELRQAARRVLPRPVFDFIDGGAGDEVTLRRNRDAFDALELRPRILRDVSTVSTATTVLGEPLSFPLMGAPHGSGLLFHPDGETGIGRALHEAGSAYVVSSMASQTFEHLSREAPGPKWMQMYLWRDHGLTRELVERARDTGGYSVLVLTVDTARVGARERDRRNGFTLPPRITLRALASGLRHPRWAASFVAAPEIGLANLASSQSVSVDLGQYALAAFDASASWDQIAWMRELWPGPIAIKGILTPEDARLAASAGVDVVLVSNHGGRQLDHAPATIAALPRIVDEVGGEVEVLMDGGVRRGADIYKALALGARACLTARPLLYGLAVAGQEGASRAIALLRQELELTMALMGRASVADIEENDVGPAPGVGVERMT